MCAADGGNPEGARGAEHCALVQECDALGLCSSTQFGTSDPCKSKNAFSCTSPPPDVPDCKNIDRACDLSDPRAKGNCSLKGSDAPCSSNAECCSGACTLHNGGAGSMYHVCCPWVYGSCSSDADCCPGMSCKGNSCVQPGGGQCIKDDQCASGHCGYRPGGTLFGYCDCVGGGTGCCLPPTTPCQDDLECCSKLCDGMKCK
jgi:hypothetical protein